MRSEASGPNDPPAKIPSTGRLSKRAPPGSNPTSWHAKAKPILPNWPVLPTILDDGTCIHFGRPACTKLPLRHQRACNRGPYQARSSGSRIHFEEDRISASGRPAALIRILTIEPLLHNGEQMRGPRKVYLHVQADRGRRRNCFSDTRPVLSSSALRKTDLHASLCRCLLPLLLQDHNAVSLVRIRRCESPFGLADSGITR